MVRSSHAQNRSESTTVVLEADTQPEHPYCEIPPYFFEFALSRQDRPRQILSIDTWDGRQVMAVEGHAQGKDS